MIYVTCKYENTVHSIFIINTHYIRLFLMWSRNKMQLFYIYNHIRYDIIEKKK